MTRRHAVPIRSRFGQLSHRRRMLREYRYLSVTLLSEVYEQATGSPPPGPHERRTWSWPGRRDWGITITRSPMTRAELLYVTERYLRRQWRPLGTAGPGGYLHIPSARLRLRALPAASMAGTAAWLHGTADDPEAGRILIALTGPIEDSSEWAGTDGTRLPVPASATELVQLLQALARGQNLPVGDIGPASGPEQQASGLAQQLTTVPSVLWTPEEVLARVLVRQPGPAPYDALVIGTPLWVRRSILPVR